MDYVILVHGGAGTISPDLIDPETEAEIRQDLAAALAAGGRILSSDGPALDAVEAAVVVLEDSMHFNAGRGSVFNSKGNHELEASIMCGKTLEAGSCAMLSKIRNPVRLARCILSESEFIFLCGSGAEQFAKENSIEMAKPEYFFSDYRWDQLLQARESSDVRLDHSGNGIKKYGTVGAVALDKNGNLAAATSTGGLTNKSYNRIGDSPIIGAGTYANNATCAVSCTGYGEFFIRGLVAHDLSCLMDYSGLSVKEAADQIIFKKQPKLGGEGGLIAVDHKGNIAMPFNSAGMYRGCLREKKEPVVKLYKTG